MLGVLTYKSIMLLARERLDEIQRLLHAKVRSGLAVNDIDRQVLYLARKAHEMLSAQPHLSVDFPRRLYGPLLGQGVSKFAVLGAVGLEIPRFAAHYARGQSWLFDTLRRGNPDPNREMVLVRSTDFALELWGRVQRRIEADSGVTDKAEAKRKMRAYVLGHLCHVAANVISHPFLQDVASHLGDANRSRLTLEQVAGAIDASVARRVLGNRPRTRGREWSAWWPEPDEVPGYFYEAYVEALEEIYGRPGARREGSPPFQERFSSLDPPALSTDLLRDGYSSRRLLLERGYAWGWGDWLWATLLMFVPAVLTFPLAGLLPNARDLFRDPEPPNLDRDKGWYELLTFPLAANSLVPLGFSIFAAAGSYLGVGRETVIGLISGSVMVVAAAVFFLTTLLGADVPWWVRWFVIFLLPLGGEIFHLAYVFKRGGGDNRYQQLALSSLTHILIAVFFVVCYALFLHRGIEGLVDGGADSGAFWGFAVLWLVITAVIWMILSAILMDRTVPELPADDFATGRPHLVRLLDDATLFHLPSVADPSLADRFFPTDRRELLKIWWEDPANDLFFRSDRHSLVFSFVETPGAADAFQIVPAPLAPTTLQQYARLLTRSVKDSGGAFSGKLKAEPFQANDVDYALPAGLVFSDHGDDKATATDHTTEAARFKRLPKTRNEALPLYHAPRSHQAVHFGRSGPVVVDEDRSRDVDGAGKIGPPAAGAPANEVVGDATTRFWAFLKPGDVIQAGPQSRVVTAVQDDNHLTVVTAFNPALPALPGGASFKRLAQDRYGDVAGGTLSPAAVGSTTINGVGTPFDVFLMPGDLVRTRPVAVGAQPEERRVVAVTSPTQITVDRGFSAAVVALTPYDRVGRERADGFNYVADADDVLFTGPTLMDRAADLAALLCLGGASHLLTDAERLPGAVGTAAGLNKAHQVFRNWNLDRRRVNEWRALVVGGAAGERRAGPASPAPRGEKTANRLGWVPLLHKWLDVARRPGVSSKERISFRPGDPTNLELSRALAFLLDMPDPEPGPDPAP